MWGDAPIDLAHLMRNHTMHPPARTARTAPHIEHAQTLGHYAAVDVTPVAPTPDPLTLQMGPAFCLSVHLCVCICNCCILFVHWHSIA